MKKCNKCLDVKEISCFSVQRGTRDGFANKCKDCANLLNKNRYQKRVLSKDYAFVKKKKCANCKNTFDRSMFNRSPNSKTHLSSYCKECHKERSLRLKNSAANVFRRIKNSAKRRGLSVCDRDYFMEWFSKHKDCYYCGSTPGQFLDNKKRILSEDRLKRFREVFSNPIYGKIDDLTIDRKNPGYGYDENNIVKACWICNYLKGGIWTHKNFMFLGMSVRREIEGIADDCRT